MISKTDLKECLTVFAKAKNICVLIDPWEQDPCILYFKFMKDGFVSAKYCIDMYKLRWNECEITKKFEEFYESFIVEFNTNKEIPDSEGTASCVEPREPAGESVLGVQLTKVEYLALELTRMYADSRGKGTTPLDYRRELFNVFAKNIENLEEYYTEEAQK